jgi:excisionase family DNA binding protein
VRGFASLLGISRVTLLRWAAAGRLPAPLVRTKKRTLWLRDAVERFLNGSAPPEDASNAG